VWLKGECELVRKALWSAALASGLTLIASIQGLASVAVFPVSQDTFSISCDNGSQTGRNYPSGEAEPQLAVNSDSSLMIAMYHQDRWSNGGAHGIGVGASTDGGATWSQTVFPDDMCTTAPKDPLHIYQRSSDPWVSFGPDGTAYASALSFNITNNFNAVVAGTSKDGVNWDVKTIPGSVFTLTSQSTDKNATTADPTIAGTAYTVWDTLLLPTDQPDDNPHTQSYTGPAYFSKTTDGGKTWSQAQVIIDTPQRQQTIGNIIVVDPKSDTLYDFTDLITSPNTPFRGTRSNAQLAFVKSTDGGKSWTQPQIIAPFNSLGVVDPLNPSLRLRVGDGLEEVAIDPTNGKLFVVWESSTNFTKNAKQSTGAWDNEILMATSSDGGASWTGPSVIHSLSSGLPTYTPTVAVNNGVVAVTYYDNRNIGTNASVMGTDYFVSLFKEDGTSLGEQRITAKSFDQLSAPNARGFFLGDYEGLQPSGSGFEALFVKTNCDAPYTGTFCGPAVFTGGPQTSNTNPTDVFAAAIS
jgi:hypothetical protein